MQRFYLVYALKLDVSALSATYLYLNISSFYMIICGQLSGGDRQVQGAGRGRKW